MAYDSKVIIKILGDATNFDKAINGAEASLNSLKGVLAKLGLATSLGAVVQQVVSNTSSLETELAKVSTLFGGVNVDMDTFTSKIMKLSEETGRASSDIASAIYQAESSGVKVTEDMGTMMSFMETATKLSVAGFTSVESAVDSLAKIQNAYGEEVISVDEISKNLVMTQNLGITTVDQLAQSLAQVTPIASSFGVSFEEVGASLAVMTKAGTDTATATTQLRAVISSLAQSDTQASKALKEASKQATGQAMTFQELQNEGYNLQKILRMMEDYAKSTGVSLVDLFSEIRAGTGALQLASDSSETFTAYLDQMKSEADIVQETYETVMETRAQSWSKLANRLKNITIKIGMGTGSQKLMDNVYSLAEDVVDKFEEWTPAINRAIMTASVGGSILFAYIKDNVEKIPTWIANAFVAGSLLSAITKALGLGTTATGLGLLSVGIKLVDGLDGTESWEDVGKDILSALATGLTIGTFAGSKAGALMFALELTGKYDLEQLGKDLGTWAETTFSALGTAFAEIFDPKNEYSASVQEGTYKIFDAIGVIANSSFSAIGTAFKNLFEGDILGAIKNVFYKGMEMTAKLFDLWDGGETGTKHMDIYKVYRARQEAPSASKIKSDNFLLQYINQAEASGIDLETYLQEVLAKIDAVVEQNPVSNIIEQNSSDVADVLSELAETGLTAGTEEWAEKAEEIIKDKISNRTLGQVPKITLNNNIAPDELLKQAHEAGVALGNEATEGTEEALDINSPSKVYQYIGEMAVAGLENGLDTETAYAVGEAVGEAVELGTRNALDIHSPAKTYEEIGELAIAGLEKGMTESALEELEKELEKTYTELGANIMKWLSEGTKDGQTYTFMDAVQDFFTGTKTYNALGKKIDKIEVKDTGIADLETGALGQGSSDDSGTEEKKSFWAKASDWLFGDIGDGEKEVGKTGFDVLNSLADSFTNLNSAISDSISASYESQISALEEARDNAKKYNELSVEEEKEYDKKIADLKKEQFEKQKKISLATAVIDGANAIMNIWKEWAGSPLMASALTAMSVATTAMQISTISSQSSGYEQGGLIGGHGYTGDKQQIWANAGELILNRAQQRAIADQLSYGGNSTVVQVTFGGNVFGDRQTIAEYVYDAIKTAQSTGAVQAW